MGVLPIARPLCRCGSVPVWSADAADNPSDGDRSAEHAHAADRCAHEIMRILNVLAARLRRRNPVLQLTACCARDRRHFAVIWCRAPRPQLNTKPLGGPPRRYVAG